MFSARDLQQRVRQRPFVPFRIVISSGESLDVLHPELIMVGARAVTVGLGTARDPTIFEQVRTVARLHVTAVEDLPGAQPGWAVDEDDAEQA